MQFLGKLPLKCLRPSEKVQVLASLVDELLDSDTLPWEVDMRMDLVNSLAMEKLNSSNDEDDESGQSEATMVMVGSEVEDKDKQYSEELTNKEVSSFQYFMFRT